jgi:hypothetical protein
MGLAGRIVGGIAGVILIIIRLIQLFGDPVLPKCGDAEATDTVRQILYGNVPANLAGDADTTKAAIALADIAETSFDEEKQTRACSVTANLTAQDTKVFDNMKLVYTITWTDRSAGKFQVEARQAQ